MQLFRRLRHNRVTEYLSVRKALLLELVWALRWVLLNRLGLASWRDFKSYRYRSRTGNEREHRKDRIVDDIVAVKSSRLFGDVFVRSFQEEEKSLLIARPSQRCFQGNRFSIIVPFADNTGQRLPLLIPSLARARELFPSVEIIVSTVAEQVDNLRDELSSISDVLIVAAGPLREDFNIACAVNTGVRASSQDYLCIMQADIYLPASIVFSFEEFEMSGKDYFFPALGVMFMDRDSTEEFIRTGVFRPRLGSYCRELESYLLLITREAFEKVGGYYEGFTESAEDNDLYDRLGILESPDRRTSAIYHLWHPPFWKVKTRTVQQNRTLLNTLRKSSISSRINAAREQFFSLHKETSSK